MSRYIDAELIMFKEMYDIGNYLARKEQIDDIPTADVAPVVHARWDSVGFDRFWNKFIFGCTRCQRRVKVSKREDLKDFPYCHCGARMDKEVKDE